METRKCKVCETVFIVTRADKLTCSKSCSCAYSYRKNTIKNDDKIVCKSCKQSKYVYQFYKKRKYSPVCKVCTMKVNQKKWDKLMQQSQYKLLSELEQWVMYIKNQRYWATDLDILKLTHFYCEVFPDEINTYNSYRHGNNEDLFNLLFLKLVNYYWKKKQQIIKNM